MKKKILIITCFLMILLNINVYALIEDKTINVYASGNHSSSSGNPYIGNKIPLGYVANIEDFDFSKLIYTNPNESTIGLRFDEYDGDKFVGGFTVQFKVLDGKINGYKIRSYYGTVKDFKDYNINYYQFCHFSSLPSGGNYEIKGDIILKCKAKEPFKLLNKLADTKQNQYKFTFNKDFNINSSDIEFKDNAGNIVNFTHTKSGQELIINATNDLKVGTYTINLKKVTSIENDELINVPLTFSIANNFYLVSRSFGDKISTDTKELNLTFNKNFTITSLSVGSLVTSNTVNGQNLKIILPVLSDETDYPMYIKLKSTDNELLELNINLSTRSITGNKSLDRILYAILRLFEEAKQRGTPLFKYAIEFGTIFIVALWLWNLLKSWLKSI